VKAEGWHGGVSIPIEVEPIGGGFYLEARAARAYKAMREAAALAGIIFIVNSAWRSMAHQRRLYVAYRVRLALWRLGKRKGAPSVVGRPGWSTHQSGLSIDLNRAHDDTTANGKADGLTDKWLQANAASFGFVNDVTSEAWHWTYLG
jgi:LAS superfamily LD-carboxypeptidase LdcB